MVYVDETQLNSTVELSQVGVVGVT